MRLFDYLNYLSKDWLIWVNLIGVTAFKLELIRGAINVAVGFALLILTTIKCFVEYKKLKNKNGTGTE